MRNNSRRHWAEVKRKKNKFSKIAHVKIIYSLLAIVFIGVTIYSFIFSSFLEVEKIPIVGLKKISSDEIQQEVNNLKNGKYLELIPKNNFLFLRSGKIKQKLKDKFKRIDEVEVEKKFPNQIKIKITERNTILVLCAEGNCYFVDRNGNAYAKADFNSDELKQNNLIKLIDESNKKIKEGENIFSEKFVKFVTNVSSKFKEKLNIDLFDEYRTRSCVAEEIIVQTSRGWDIYLSTRFPIKKSIRMIKILFDKQLTLKEINNLEYIDLRSENKIFYRMKGDATKEEKEIEAMKKDETKQKDLLEKNIPTP